jgi:hypothetical protein
MVQTRPESARIDGLNDGAKLALGTTDEPSIIRSCESEIEVRREAM